MFALIDEAGRVCEFFAHDPGPWPLPQRIVDVSNVAGIAENWMMDGDGMFSPPPSPFQIAMVPQEISLRQLLFALRDQGWITHGEALAAARTGAMPGTLTATLAGSVTAGAMSAEQVEDAELIWAAMYTAVRTDTLWDLFVATGAATEAQVDALFMDGATR